MSTLIRLFCFLIITSIIPTTNFSLTAADFNKKIAEASQSNSPALAPPCNCPSTNNTSTPVQASPAPIYYTPPKTSINANPAAAPATPSNTSNTTNQSLWGGGDTKNSSTPSAFTIAY